jgi:hypothetical protein
MAQTGSDASSSSGNEKPGDKRDPKEIANQLAGYTGFTDLADLRRFLVSRPMLEVTAEILKDPPLANVLWVDVAPHFDSCLRLGGVQMLEQKYGENINLRNAFPKISHPDWSIETTAAKNRPNRAHRMAAWIFRLKNRIASYEKQDSSGRQAKYEKALNSFKGVIRNQETIIPHCDPLLVKLPVLGPIMELNEINQVRPYHRVYHLWLYLHTQSFMVSRSSGPRYLFDLCYPFVSEPVLPGFFSDHTREIINASVSNSRKRTQEILEPTDESLQKKQKLAVKIANSPTTQGGGAENRENPVKKFAYRWLSDLDDQDAKDHLKAIEPQLQRTGFINQDPTQARCCEFRNSIRRQFDFAKHKLQLHILELQHPSRLGDANEVKAEKSPWDTAIGTLDEHPADSPEEVVLIFGVRLLRENEQLLESVRKPTFINLMSVDDRY